MSSELGNKVRVSVYGESHAKEIGVKVTGLPKGESIDLDALGAFLKRRRPGKSPLATPRFEADLPIFKSGLEDGVLTGDELWAIIENTNTRSNDYDNLHHKPRPGHADYTAFLKYGDSIDMRGGGPFSGRLTAPICIAGGIAKQILERRGVKIAAHVKEIAEIPDKAFDLVPSDELMELLASKSIPVIDDDAGERMAAKIREASDLGDSVGGVVECVVKGFPAGIGGPLFDGLEGELAKSIFGIPAVKGVEFGNGFETARLKGSKNNDDFCIVDGKVKTKTNNHGGILGGISSGMPILLRAAFKPTPSISLPQATVDLDNMTETTIEIAGRHDPCVVIRAVPVVEAVVAITLLDLLS